MDGGPQSESYAPLYNTTRQLVKVTTERTTTDQASDTIPRVVRRRGSRYMSHPPSPLAPPGPLTLTQQLTRSAVEENGELAAF